MDQAIEGFAITHDALLEGGIVPLAEGLTAIYGRNGAGKSRLLEGIRNALLGRRTDTSVTLIARIHQPNEADFAADNFQRGIRAPGCGLLLALAESAAQPDDYELVFFGGVHDKQGLALGRASEIVSAIIRREIGPVDTPETMAVLEEVLQDRLFALHPTGNREFPSWDAWPIADVTRPAATTQLQRYVLADELSDDEWDSAWDAAGEGNPLAPLDDRVVTRTFDSVSPRGFAFICGWWRTSEPLAGIALNGPIDLGLDVLEVDLPPAIETTEYISDLVLMIGAAIDHSGDGGEVSLRKNFSSLGFNNREGRRESLRRDSGMAADDPEWIEQLGRRASRIGETVRTAAANLQDRVNRSLSNVLLDAPLARLEIAPPELRFTHPSVEWRFSRSQSDGQSVPFTVLSTAEQKWASHAISEALYWHRRDELMLPSSPTRPLLSLIDEPETALHRVAESYMASGLARSVTDPRSVIIAATHSPEILDQPIAKIIEVKRGAGSSGRSLVQQMTLGDRDSLQTLGLNPSDLLRLQRVFLLVEGMHDEVVLNTLIGPRLAAARVQVLPLRGATKLPNTVDSRVLFNFTQARVVALIDNISADILSDAWLSAQAVRLSQGNEHAKKVIVDRISGPSEEERFMREWLTAALDRGLESRISPYGLSERDIIEYLPVEYLVPNTTSWEELRRDHLTAKSTTKTTPRDFKVWLTTEYRADFSSDAVRAAAASCSTLPPELERLARYVESIAAEGQ